MQPADNPYSPPKALVQDVTPETPAHRNAHVELACVLMWVSLGLSTLDTSWTVIDNRDSPFIYRILFETLLGFGIGLLLILWFTWKLRAGRNWMRILINVLSVIGLIATAVVFVALDMSAAVLSYMFQIRPIQTTLMFLQLTMSVAEVVLINTPTARAWFYARRSSY